MTNPAQIPSKLAEAAIEQSDKIRELFLEEENGWVIHLHASYTDAWNPGVGIIIEPDLDDAVNAVQSRIILRDIFNSLTLK